MSRTCHIKDVKSHDLQKLYSLRQAKPIGMINYRMKEVRNCWLTVLKKANDKDVEIGIKDIDLFEYDIAKILLSCFKPEQIVIDGGCTTGRFCFWLERKMKVNPIGVDVVPRAVELANHYAKKSKSKAMFIVGDVTKLPLRNCCADGVLSLGVVEHFRSEHDVILAFREAYRILKPSGKAIFVIPNFFVPLRNKILRFISKGRLGMFHRTYTASRLSILAQCEGFNCKVKIFDLYTPIFNVIDGLCKLLKISIDFRSRIRLALKGAPQLSFLKIFLGYIAIIEEKRRV